MDQAPAWHESVMVASVLHLLDPKPGAIIVDGTVGTGGHSVAILPHLLPSGRLIAMDRDPEAIAASRARLIEFEPQVTFIHDDFRDLARILRRLGIRRVHGLLLDLGMSSVQVDRPARGFSFSKDGPLDMRMNPQEEPCAADLVSTLSADELAMILRRYGEEPFAQRIARCIVQARSAKPLTTTTQLARVVARAVPARVRHGRLHRATRTFQALRIAVNDELRALEDVLRSAPALLHPGGRLVVLTFHSLEDRLVKHAFALGAHEGSWKLLTKKPLRPAADEVARNPRARSAKLRAVARQLAPPTDQPEGVR